MNKLAIEKKVGLMKKVIRFRGALGIALLLLLAFFILHLFDYLFISANFFTTSVSLLGLLGVLLAVTFTSYSILFVAMPFIKKILLKTNAIGGIGILFLFTIYIEMFAIIIDFLVQVAQGRFIVPVQLEILDFYLATYSFLMIGLLSYYVHLVFENARKWSAPAEFRTLFLNSHLVSPQLLSSRTFS